MAMTSTQFMAAPGGFSATLSNKLDKIDCSQVLAAVLNADTALLGHIKMGAVGHNIEHNWIEDGLNPAYVLASCTSVGTVVCSTYTTASLQRILRKNVILNPAGTEIRWQCDTSVTLNSIFGGVYGSTTWASWTTTKCYIVGMPYADIDAASSDISVTRTKRRNFMQVLERAIEITQTRSNMNMEAVTNELQTQIKRRTLEIKRELDMSVIRGYAKATGANTYSGAHELRTMAGIIQLIRDPDLDSDPSDTLVTQVSGALTIAGVNSLVHKIFDEGGLDEEASPIILVGAKQARVIASWEKELRRVEQGERTVGYYRNIFLSDLGVEFPIVLDRWMPNDKLIILDRSRVSLSHLANDAWHMEKMAKTGRNQKWQLSGQYTLELRNANECHGMLYDLT